MMNKGLLSFFFILIIHFFELSLFSQANKPLDIHFYLLTYTPGNELYSAFGHSAIRYKNRSKDIDVVYNYGTFNFNDPDFYSKFIKGKLDYHLSRVETHFVVKATRKENRCLFQNEILLTYKEKIALLNALEDNYQPENRHYRYDFLYDNCATRISALIDSVTGERFTFLKKDAKNLSFDRLITTGLEKYPLANLGFSFITGAEVLKIATVKESQFLPQHLQHYLSLGIDNSKNQKLLDKPTTILNCSKDLTTRNNYLNLLFTILLFFWIIIKVIERIRGKEYYFANLVVFIPGFILGLCLLGLWIISEHLIFAWNYNLLWANPLIFILLIPKYKSNRVLNFTFLACFLLSIGLTIVLKGFYLPVFVLVVIQMLRLKLKQQSV
jgi:hypothetical protein